jgi:hypothetical protein
VIAPVAKAVDVLQRLHPHSLLFPIELRRHGDLRGITGSRPRSGVRLQNANLAITSFVSWINAYCDEHGLHDECIPDDPRGLLALSRFRRTLAWHIVRRPRGLIAGAIQYGHLHVNITLGYAKARELH